MINKELSLKAIFINKTKTKNNNYFFDFLIKNSKVITLFCNKLDYPKNIKIGEEWKITFTKNKTIKNWLFGDVIKKNENKANWFICFNEWIRQILQINKVSSIYKLYQISLKTNIDEETAILINIFFKLLKK